MFCFIWSWACNIWNHVKIEVHDIHGTMWHTQPNHINIKESCFGHGCVTWFDDNHKKHNYMTQLIQPQAQDHHMLPRPNLGNNLYHYRQRGYVIYYEDETERGALCMSSPWVGRRSRRWSACRCGLMNETRMVQWPVLIKTTKLCQFSWLQACNHVKY